MPLLPATATPPCGPSEIILSVDPRDGDFNGMSHSGTYLVIRNAGPRACRVPGLPTVALHGTRGALAIALRSSARMHPAPVIIPAGGRVASGLRWVSGPVYDRNRRLDIRSVSLVIAGRTLRTPLQAEIFAQVGRPATFSQSPLALYR